MADLSTPGKDVKKVGKASSLTRILSSPARSPSSKPKGSSSSSNPWKRLLRRFSSRKDLDKDQQHSSSFSSESERGRGAEADIETEEKAKTSPQPPIQLPQPTPTIKENTAEEATVADKPKDSATVENVEKTNDLPGKVEPKQEKPKEELKEKANLEETRESPEEKVIIKDVVIVKTDKPSDIKQPIGGLEGGMDINQSPVTNEESSSNEEDNQKKEGNCVSSLAQGLQTLCAPRNTE